MSALHFSKKDFEERVLKSKKPVMVDFFGEWCPPCRLAGPVIESLAKDYEGKIVVGKVDVDQNQELAQKFGVMSIPTVIFFKEGKEIERVVGFPGKAGYEQVIKKVLKE